MSAHHINSNYSLASERSSILDLDPAHFEQNLAKIDSKVDEMRHYLQTLRQKSNRVQNVTREILSTAKLTFPSTLQSSDHKRHKSENRLHQNNHHERNHHASKVNVSNHN